MMNAVQLSLAANRLAAICEEMGGILKRSALSPNIKDREDYSCALFTRTGELIAQAAHIPVHLGSMVYAMRGIADGHDWRAGDTLVFNDPALGGTHLPDVTVVVPIFQHDRHLGFAVSRAHHADIGGKTPGSMGLHRRLRDEGCIISPTFWFRAGEERSELTARFRHDMRAPAERLGDLQAQRAACMLGARRLCAFVRDKDAEALFDELLSVSERYARQAIAAIPDGCYRFADALEDDGLGHGPFAIQVTLSVRGGEAHVDFTGTAAEAPGPINCPFAVTAAAVYYVFRCLMPTHTPQTSAIFHPIALHAPAGSLVHATAQAAVAAGNVETSQRIVDVLLGALAQALPERIPAAAQGTMNNVIFGGLAGDWVYYETMGGGMGAHAQGAGLSAVQCHMTNTRNSAIEVVEMHYPLRITRYAIREGSGGVGRHRGGDGLIREWELLAPCHVSLLSERRASAPFGLNGGGPGQPGRNLLKHPQGAWREVAAKFSRSLQTGDRLRVETPGGGGYGGES